MKDNSPENQSIWQGRSSGELHKPKGGVRIPIILRQFAVSTLGVGSARCLTFFTGVILARHLSTDQFGVFSLGYTIMVLLGQFPGVIDTALVRNHHMLHDEASRRAMLRVSVHLKLLFIAVVVLVVGFVGRVFPGFSAKFGRSSIILPALLAGAFQGLNTTGTSYFQARGRFALYSGLLIAISGSILVGIITLTRLGYSTASEYLRFYFVTFLVVGLITIALVQRHTTRLVRSKWCEHCRALLGLAGWLVPAMLCALLLQRIDVLILSVYVDDHTLGLYGAAARVVGMFSLLTASLYAVLLPAVSRIYHTEGRLKGPQPSHWLGAVGTGLVIFLGALMADKLILLTVGERYISATSSLSLLLIGYMFVAFSLPSVCFIIASGRTFLIFCQRVLELTTGALGVSLLSPRFSMNGAAFSMALASGLGLVFVTTAVILMRRGSSGG